MKITVQHNEDTDATTIAIVNESTGETVRSVELEEGQIGCVWLGATTEVPEIAIEAASGDTPEPQGGEPAADPRGGDGAVEAPAGEGDAGDAGDAGAAGSGDAGDGNLTEGAGAGDGTDAGAGTSTGDSGDGDAAGAKS